MTNNSMFNQWAKHGVDVHAYVYNILFHAKEWETGAQEKDYIAFFFFHNVTLSESLSSDQADQKEKTFEPLSYLMASMWINFFNTLSPNNIPSKWHYYVDIHHLEGTCVVKN